jgi:hypothetical protein
MCEAAPICAPMRQFPGPSPPVALWMALLFAFGVTGRRSDLETQNQMLLNRSALVGDVLVLGKLRDVAGRAILLKIVRPRLGVYVIPLGMSTSS